MTTWSRTSSSSRVSRTWQIWRRKGTTQCPTILPRGIVMWDCTHEPALTRISVGRGSTTSITASHLESWNEVGTVGVFQGDERVGDVLEEEWHKHPPLPGRLFLLEEGRASLPALVPPGAEGLFLSRAHHQRAQVLIDPGFGVASARLRCCHDRGQVSSPRGPLGSP